jgi:formyl-CoA transferase
MPELVQHPDYHTNALRSSNRDALHAVREARLREQDTAHWIALLNEAGVPCGPINTVDQAFNDPQAQHLGIVQQVDGVA